MVCSGLVVISLPPHVKAGRDSSDKDRSVPISAEDSASGLSILV